MKLFVALAFGVPLTIPSCVDRSPTITMAAPATFEKREAGAAINAKDFFDIYLRVMHGTRSYDILWAVEVQGRTTSFFPVELTPGKTYSFTLVEERPSEQDSAVDRDFKVPHIARIEELYKPPNALPLYDRAICEVHHCKMQRKLVPVIYGMLGWLYTPQELKTLFPHYQEFVAGGCIAGDRKTDRVFACAKCKVTYANWLKANAHRAYSTNRK